MTSACRSRTARMRAVFTVVVAVGVGRSAAAQDQVDAVALGDQMATARHVLPVLRDPTGGQAQAAPETEFLLIASTDGGVTGRARIGIFATNKFLADAIVSGPISQGTAQ